MKFEYNNNFCEKKAIEILIFSSCIWIVLFTVNLKTLGLVFIVASIAISFILNTIALFKSNFVFNVQEKVLEVTYGKKVVDFLWTDVQDVNEDDRGLIIRMNRNDVELPVLNDMKQYIEFRTQIKKKAYEFGFPIILYSKE